MNKEEFEKLVNELRSKLDETSSALVSEESLAIISAFNTVVDDMDAIVTENEKLKSDKEELLKVNGKLYQKIGFTDDKEEKEEEIDDSGEEIKIEEVIDEKGDLI